MNEILIRDLTQYGEFIHVHQIQKICWGFSDGEGLYPPMLLTVSQNGGVVLGAFDGQKMVGFIFGFPGFQNNQDQLKLCSQTMGVLPEYRGHGIAQRLKWAQRDRALKLGYSLITWTYDPLEGPNAQLNLHNLKGFVRTYKRDIYGEHFGVLNEGLPTDRFMVEWWIKDTEEIQSDFHKHIDCFEPQIAISAIGQEADQKISDFNLELDGEIISVEIPINIQKLRKTAPDISLDWRYKTRHFFETYFSRGYVAVDFLRKVEDGQLRNIYLLWRPSSDWLINKNLSQIL